MNLNLLQMFLKSRIYRFWLDAVGSRFVPFRYYVIEFFCYVVSGIEFYKNYRRFYTYEHFFCLTDKCKRQCQNCKNIYDAS